jgi:SAM-dependent methyltransferase
MWLAERVGPSGRVVGTDIDVRWVREPIAPNVEILEHDVAEDEPPEGPFDLVHERLVLIHVPERERALARMAAALKPGGWILVEDFETGKQPVACLDPRTPMEELANRIRAGFGSLLRARGAFGEIGYRLPNMLRDAGLVDVGAEGYRSLVGPMNNHLERANVEQVRDGLIGQGFATADEIDSYLVALTDRTVEVAQPILISAWGRKS